MICPKKNVALTYSIEGWKTWCNNTVIPKMLAFGSLCVSPRRRLKRGACTASSPAVLEREALREGRRSYAHEKRRVEHEGASPKIFGGLNLQPTTDVLYKRSVAYKSQHWDRGVGQTLSIILLYCAQKPAGMALSAEFTHIIPPPVTANHTDIYTVEAVNKTKLVSWMQNDVLNDWQYRQKRIHLRGSAECWLLTQRSQKGGNLGCRRSRDANSQWQWVSCTSDRNFQWENVSIYAVEYSTTTTRWRHAV